MTFSFMTFSIMTFNIMMLRGMKFNKLKNQHNDIQHNWIQHKNVMHIMDLISTLSINDCQQNDTQQKNLLFICWVSLCSSQNMHTNSPFLVYSVQTLRCNFSFYWKAPWSSYAPCLLSNRLIFNMSGWDTTTLCRFVIFVSTEMVYFNLGIYRHNGTSSLSAWELLSLALTHVFSPKWALI